MRRRRAKPVFDREASTVICDGIDDGGAASTFDITGQRALIVIEKSAPVSSDSVVDGWHDWRDR